MMCEQVRETRPVEGLMPWFPVAKGLDTRDSLTLAGLLDQHPGRAKGGAGEGRGGRPFDKLRDRTSADKPRDRTFGAKTTEFCPESPDSRPRQVEVSRTHAQPKHAHPPSLPACRFWGSTCTTHGP